MPSRSSLPAASAFSRKRFLFLTDSEDRRLNAWAKGQGYAGGWRRMLHAKAEQLRGEEKTRAGQRGCPED